MAFSLSQIMYQKCRSLPLLFLFRMIVFFSSPPVFPFCVCLFTWPVLVKYNCWGICAWLQRASSALPSSHKAPVPMCLTAAREKGGEEVKMERSRKSQRWRWLVRFCIAYASQSNKSYIHNFMAQFSTWSHKVNMCYYKMSNKVLLNNYTLSDGQTFRMGGWHGRYFTCRGLPMALRGSWAALCPSIVFSALGSISTELVNRS